MNVERLHRIALDLKSDLKRNKIISLIQNVRDSLQNAVSNPSHGPYQTELVTHLDSLYNALKQCDYNEYSHGWKEIINEISSGILFGILLEEYIQNIFSQNTITPAKALEDIIVMHDRIVNFDAALINITSAFNTLNIEEEDLDPGQCEFGYMIPRKYVQNKLSALKKEINELNFILNSISEAVTGEKQEFDVKTISSSEFLLYILISLSVGDVLSKAIERILNLYKQILEIKVLRNQLKEKGIPSVKTKAIETHTNSMMEEEIKLIAKEVISEFYKGGDISRKNELENSIVISLNKLANRIDHGFNIEIRVEPLPQPADGEAISKEKLKEINLVKSIQNSSKNIQFIETHGESILGLPENKSE